MGKPGETPMNKKIMWSILVLIGYILIFTVVTKGFNQDKSKDEKDVVEEDIVDDEKPTNDEKEKDDHGQGKPSFDKTSQEEIIDYTNSLIDQLYVEPSREEVQVDIPESIYEDIEEALDAIEDEEIASDLQLDVAMSISHLYFQEDIREALADEDVFEELTDEDMEDFAVAFEVAELNTPSFADYIEPEYEELLKKYEEE